MKRLTLFLMCVMVSFALTAQNTRLVKGLVFSEDDIPMKGVTLKAVGMEGTAISAESGQFELYVSPYAKKVEASMEGYISHVLEIDGSYLVFKLKVDKEYAKRKAAEEEAARVAAEQAKAAEEARIAAEKEAAEKAAAEKAAEEERVRKAAEKEAAAKAKAEERARKAAEREAIAQAKAAERAAQVKATEKTSSATSSKMVEVNSREKAQEVVASTKKLGVKKSKKNVERLSWADNVRRAHNEKSGYRSFVEYSELDVDACAYLQGVSYIGGYYVAKQRIFFGIGLSHLEGWGITSGAHMNSLYLHGKWYVTKSLIRPYVAVSTGLESYVSDHPSTGVYFNPQAGISVPIFKKLETYASIGYYCTSRKCASIHPAYHVGWTFNVGISF